MKKNSNMPNLFSLKNRVAVVTGALGLLGQQHCFALAEAGANIVVADLDEKKCKEFAREMTTHSIGVYLDITKHDSVRALSMNIVNEFGRIDIIVNNAAINDMVENPDASADASRFENYPLGLFRKVMEVNVTGAFLCSQILGKEMVRQKKGSIINIASTYGMVAPNQSLYKMPDGRQSFYKSPAYPTAKGAVLSFTRYLAAYWGNSGIRVNALSPGGVENNQQEYFIRNYSEKTPLGRMAAPNDYRGALVFLASDASSYMTGANLVVDGGWTIW